jgi:hypothetical protein
MLGVCCTPHVHQAKLQNVWLQAWPRSLSLWERARVRGFSGLCIL